MAATAFNTAHPAEPVRGRRQAVLAALRQMLDAFVSYRMRLAVAKARLVRPRQPQDTSPSPRP